jgi:hypothetical protein
MVLEMNVHGYEYVATCLSCHSREAGDGHHRFPINRNFRRVDERIAAGLLLAVCPERGA